MTIHNQTQNSIRFVAFDKFSPKCTEQITVPAGGEVKLRKGYRLNTDTLHKLTPTGLEVIGKNAGCHTMTQPHHTYIF